MDVRVLEELKRMSVVGQQAHWAVVWFAALLIVIAPAAAETPPRPEFAIPDADDAPIAMLVDITSGQVLHSRNSDRRFVPASITKAMTLYHAFELIEEGALDPRQSFTIKPETWREWAGKGSTMWLNARDPVLVDNLLFGIANVSANDGSVVLAEGQAGSLEAWADGMNARARALGMTGSHFGTPNGWPDDGATFTTARDLVTLARAMISRHPKKFARYIGRPSFTYNGIEQYNHDPLIGRTPGADGIKTGYTNEAGFGYLGTAVRDGQRLVLVVAGSPRSRARDAAARNYIEWGFRGLERRRLFHEGEIVENARVQGGGQRSVALRTDRPIFINVPRGYDGDIAVNVTYEGPLRAPFTDGDQVAELKVTVPGFDDAHFPLLAARTVERAGWFARIVNAIAAWFA